MALAEQPRDDKGRFATSEASGALAAWVNRKSSTVSPGQVMAGMGQIRPRQPGMGQERPLAEQIRNADTEDRDWDAMFGAPSQKLKDDFVKSARSSTANSRGALLKEATAHVEKLLAKAAA